MVGPGCHGCWRLLLTFGECWPSAPGAYARAPCSSWAGLPFVLSWMGGKIKTSRSKVAKSGNHRPQTRPTGMAIVSQRHRPTSTPTPIPTATRISTHGTNAGNELEKGTHLDPHHPPYQLVAGGARFHRRIGGLSHLSGSDKLRRAGAMQALVLPIVPSLAKGPSRPAKIMRGKGANPRRGLISTPTNRPTWSRWGPFFECQRWLCCFLSHLRSGGLTPGSHATRSLSPPSSSHG